MSWDIHGEPLAPNHCEVHPDVPEPYPCLVCSQERRRHDEERQMEEEYHAQMEREYYASLEHEDLIHQDLGPCPVVA